MNHANKATHLSEMLLLLPLLLLHMKISRTPWFMAPVNISSIARY